MLTQHPDCSWPCSPQSGVGVMLVPLDSSRLCLERLSMSPVHVQVRKPSGFFRRQKQWTDNKALERRVCGSVSLTAWLSICSKLFRTCQINVCRKGRDNHTTPIWSWSTKFFLQSPSYFQNKQENKNLPFSE